MEDWLVEAKLKLKRMPDAAKEVRAQAMEDLEFFARLVNPGYMYGEVHKEIFRWMQDYSLYGQGEDLTSNKLIMLPRAHLKSHMVATWCAWVITRHPEVTILYVSATAELAQTQLYAVQNILGSTLYRRYFPEYVNPQEGKRERWSSVKLSIDHPKRKEEAIRDATISTAGLTTNTTGWHADIVVADDLVVPENAYTTDGRESVSKKSSQFTSIRNAGGFTMACGTRYHPIDIYDVWQNQVYDIFDDEGIKIDQKLVWDKKEYKVETDNIFTWPRAVRTDGKAFGFDINTLARIRGEYSDRIQFYAQYYNDPSDPGSDRISRDKFQYYNSRHLKKEGSRWFYNGRKLNVYAAVDFAFSLSKAADYTAIVVVGVDCDSNYYILDIDRFKTDKTIEYFKHVAALHSKWRFQKLRAEVSVAQKVIVNSIKDYVRKEGLRLSVDEFRPSKAEGTKEERIAAALEHLYDNLQVWHQEGGWSGILEEELVLARPAHDDVKDALASAVEIAVSPAKSTGSQIKEFFNQHKTNSRFGGMSY
jgi:predicted phage terminase large subunit-like protein